MRLRFKLLLVLAILLLLPDLSANALPAGVPSSLEAPVISGLKLLKTDRGVPYFCLEVFVPQAVMDLNAGNSAGGWVDIETSGKVDLKDWGSSGGGRGSLDIFMKNPVPGKKNSFYMYFEMSEADLTEYLINTRNYVYRLRFCYNYKNEGSGMGSLLSDWSNELSNQSESYLGADPWAVKELDKGAEYGFVTNKIKGNMSYAITREEFAEIAVKLYEACSGQKAEAGDKAFSDTDNPEISKAYELGLLDGVGGGRFAPDKIITRAQMAKIIMSTFKAVEPDIELPPGDTASYDDDASILPWAREGIYFCSQASILNGYDSDDTKLFKPDSNATRQTAVIACKRAYDYYMYTLSDTDEKNDSDNESFFLDKAGC